MTHGSLFSGIGGFDLAARWAGWDNLFNCEIDLFCRTVLKYHFPDAEQYGDIKTTDFAVWRDRIDVLSGGFPCQPFSQAGKRKGTEDDRYLWPEMLGVIRSVRPRWVVGENVLGIVNWSKGLVFEQVCSDLEAEGYEVQAFILPACSVDAPHQRYRTWFVAKNTECIRCNGCKSKEESGTGQLREFSARDYVRIYGKSRIASDCADAGTEDMQERENGIHAAWITPDPEIVYGRDICGQESRQEAFQVDCNAGIRSRWEHFPTQPPVYRGNDGFSDRLDFEAVFEGIPSNRRKRTKLITRWRTEAIKAYGNAIVPQVAYRIFETINEYENYHAEQIFKIV